MAAPFQWHPGTAPLNPRWVLHTPLLPDELLSSWLVRAALAQGCDPLVLTGCVWPGWRIWTGDPDRKLSPKQSHALAEVSGIPAASFQAAFLENVAGATTRGSLEKKQIWPWILVLGMRNRKWRGGLQYCPLCLREHPSFYRIPWRLAWHTVCAEHRIRLLDRCPDCHAPVEPHRLSPEDSITRCARCGFSLEEAPVLPGREMALAFQNRGDTAALSGTGFFGEEELPGFAWFDLSRILINLMRRASKRPSSGIADMLRILGIPAEDLKTPSTGLPWEYLSTEERESFGEAAGIILNSGPGAFLEAAKKSGVSAKSLWDFRERPPRILLDLAEALPKPVRTKRKSPSGEKTPRSRRSVERMLARLERKAKNT